MKARFGVVFSLALPLLLGMRDPFQPPEDRCAAATLSRWHYHGAIVSQGKQIGLMRDAAGGWRRVQPGTPLPGGWQVLLLTERELLIATGPGCTPERWRWPREGLKNEDTFTGDNIAVVAVPGDNAASGLADGG